jgi:hypothetical protein
VALDADLQSLGEVEHHLVLDTELPRQLVDPDLLRCQGGFASSAALVVVFVVVPVAVVAGTVVPGARRSARQFRA